MSFQIVALGELLWDILPSGRQMGGAPANFAYHAHALGARANLITRVGSDSLGRDALSRLRDIGLSDINLQIDAAAPTGTAKVELSGNGLAQFVIEENVAWDFIALSGPAIAAAKVADAISFGTLAQRSQTSRATVQHLITVSPRDALRIFDINLRQHFYSRVVIEQSLRLANVLKLNNDELPVLANILGLTGSIESQIEFLSHAFELNVIALTRGAQGSLLYQQEKGIKRWSERASKPVVVVDTVGAGDSFAAALVLGLLNQMDLDEVNSIANEVARYVCSQPGATPTLPAAFASKFGRSRGGANKDIL